MEIRFNSQVTFNLTSPQRSFLLASHKSLESDGGRTHAQVVETSVRLSPPTVVLKTTLTRKLRGNSMLYFMQCNPNVTHSITRYT